jgi:hypothetical protein
MKSPLNNIENEDDAMLGFYLLKTLRSIWFWTSILLVLFIFYGDWFHREVNRIVASTRLDRQQALLHTVDEMGQYTIAQSQILLRSVPSAARVRVSNIYTGLDGKPRFDTNYAVASAGHSPGVLTTNQPLALWRNYLDELLDKKCAFVDVTKRGTDNTAYPRLAQVNYDAFIVCPIYSQRGHMVGAVFLVWDEMKDVPSNLVEVEAQVRQTASRLGVRDRSDEQMPT